MKPKELYLYYPIYDFVAEKLISEIEDHMDEAVTIRSCTPGGSVFAAYGIYAKIKEHGNVMLKVDGNSDSAGAFLPLFAKTSECLDTSRITFHRADMYVETDEDQAFLDSVNKDLKSFMKKKINPAKWKEATGMTIDEMFDPDTRKDFVLTGKQAKDVGLVDKVVKLTPEMQREMSALNQRFYQVAAENKPTPQPIPTQKNTTMTLEKLKAEHPELFKEIFDLGIAQEKDRVEAALVYNEIDPKGVKAIIESGKPLSQKQMAEFGLKAVSAESLKKLKEGAADEVVTDEAAAVKTEKEKNLSEFEAKVKASLNADKKKEK